MKPFDWEAECSLGQVLAFYARKVPEHPAKIRIFKWLTQLKKDPVFVYGKEARFYALADDYIGNSIIYQGVWESLSLVKAVQIMKGDPKATFLDVGANHGIFSIVVGTLTGCPCLAIEPMEENYTGLLKNIQLNPDLNIQTFLCAATAEKTQVSLSQEKKGAKAWTKVSKQTGVGAKKSVAGRTLDEILKTVDCKKVRLMKIDVEGFELEVFKGLDWDSSLAPEAVLMECQPHEIDKIKYLEKRGYKPKTVEGDSIKGKENVPEGNLLFTKNPS